MLAIVTSVGLLCLLLAVVGDGNLAIAIAPLLLALLILVVCKAPLRHTLLAVAFLSITLENPSEAFAGNIWQSPLAVLGALLLGHLNLTIPVRALIFSGLDVVLLFLAGLWACRRSFGSTVDLGAGYVPPAPAIRRAALVCIGAIGLIWALGMARGGFSFSNSLWQIFRVIYLPCVVLLCCAALRGPLDARVLGIALLVAALLRAALAVYIRHLYPDPLILAHATTHADSMLFSDAFLLVLVLAFERPTRKSLALAVATLPLLTWGMVANNRRLAWVELLIGLLVLYFVTPMTKVKRRVAQAIALSIPLLVIYVAVGWNVPSGIFAPVRTLRSVVDSQVDTSTLWRDLENYNLYFTLRSSPLLGIGFGHEYVESVTLPDISTAYSLYRYAPHNSILGLLAYSGVVGFAAIWLMIPLGIFFAVRAYDASTLPRDRVAALTSIGILVGYVVHCYGDMGLGTFTSVFTVGPVLALMAKQAVAVGAWPIRPRRLVG